MTKPSQLSRWCNIGTGDFPAIPTALALIACFGEALLQKYLAPARSIQIALALVQAIPAGLLVRYLLGRSSKPNDGDRPTGRS